MNKHIIQSSIVAFTLALVSCGGGSSNSGAPEITNQCAIEGVSISSGRTATISRSSDSLSTSFTLAMMSANNVEIISNFENATGNDWIEALPFQANFTAGNQAVTIQYDLNSPSRTVADRYTKLNITARLPDNQACVVNQTVNIELN